MNRKLIGNNNKNMNRILSSLLILLFSISNYSAFATMSIDLPQWQYMTMKGSPSLRGAAIIEKSLWVTGSNNSVFVSQDGGVTWQDKSVNASVITDFRDIALFDHQTAIVMGVGNGQSSRLYKTVDGGENWHLLYQNTDEQGFFDSIAFWDNNQGLLLGDPVDGYYVVKKTRDGGKTWQRIAKNKLPPILDKEAAFAASGNTLIVGENGKAYLTTGGFSSSVYVSEDYGESWLRYSVPLYQETQTAGGYGLALNHKGEPFVLGGDYQQRPKQYANMARLDNDVWVSVNSGENGLRTAMSCQGNICIATGKTGIDVSFNAGKHWQVYQNKNVPAGDKGFYTLASDRFVFVAAGADGKVGVLSFQR
ncbi:YCF48-related protein [Colwellia sp. 1_MG-2023]|uniref:WD40/YVTN/BNR-like repeat-containing protein n=1 Tax=Colwellia sp. 1_MG-2023 TaxID=3062649 RepID=UPI0026E1B526|nr:YCF48-related protein [Colwellia sp. 1_MG-2023]MDO6444623.1 YCF48-related protein [Colwellia sp. 1_MG-2023]